MFSGYENFVSKLDLEGETDRPPWMGTVDFSGLKMKLIASIVAISGIQLLKFFMNIDKGDAPIDEAQAQQAQQGSQIEPGSLTTYRVPGGYSTTLSDIWGPPKMPATPKDFGPHFDFPAGGDQTLTCGAHGTTYYCGGLSDSPYPN